MFVSVILSAVLSAGAVTTDQSEHLTRLVATMQGAESDRARQEILLLGLDAIPGVMRSGAAYQGEKRDRVVQLISQFGIAAYESIYEVALRDSHTFGSSHAVEKLGFDGVAAMGASATDTAAGVMSAARPGGAEYWFATEVLKAQKLAAVPALLRLELHSSDEVRSTALFLLQQSGDVRGVERALAAARDPNLVVRSAAMLALSRISDVRAIPVAQQAMFDRFDSVRWEAVDTLARNQRTAEYRSRFAFLSRSDASPLVRSTATTYLLRSREPVATSLGQRYNPVSIDPPAQAFLETRRILFLLVSLAVAAFLCVVGTSASSRATTFVTGAFAASPFAVGLLGLGWLWGRWVNGITAWTEYEFLLVSLGIPAVMGAFAGARVVKENKGRFMKIWLGLVACGYLGYFVGWMQLWGWSFEWLELFGFWWKRLWH